MHRTKPPLVSILICLVPRFQQTTTSRKSPDHVHCRVSPRAVTPLTTPIELMSLSIRRLSGFPRNTSFGRCTAMPKERSAERQGGLRKRQEANGPKYFHQRAKEAKSEGAREEG